MLEGAHIAGCRIETVAGRGGMGIVYRATQLSLGRPVALKLIAPEHAADADFRERFQRESRMAAAIDHPNVIPVYEAGEEDGRLYLVMRWVAGTDLHKLLRAEGRLEPQRAAAIVNQVAGALDAAHAAGLVHRDVKPANVLLSGEHAYLADFGLTRFAGADTHLTTAGHFLGTVDYMAPGAVPSRAQRRARGRLRAGLRAVRRAHRRAAVPARDGAGDDARAPARHAAAAVATRAACRRASIACWPARWPRRRRTATRRPATSAAPCDGRGRGPLGHRGGALGGARRGRSDDPPRREPVVGAIEPPPPDPAPAPAPDEPAPIRTYRARRPRRLWAWASGVVAIAAAALAIAVVPGGAGTPPPGEPVSEGEVRRLANSFASAYADEDEARISRLLTSDAQRVSPTDRQRGRDAGRGRLQEPVRAQPDARFELSDL